MLYLPGSNARAIEKARTLACDVVILDLEDSVAPDAKVAARALAAEAVRAGGFGRRELVIRTNGLDTPWGREDLAAAAAAGPDAVLVPKVGSPQDLAAYRQAVGAGPALWAMIETCQAVFALRRPGQGLGASGCHVLGRRDQRPRQGDALQARRRPCALGSRPGLERDGRPRPWNRNPRWRLQRYPRP